MSAEQISGLIQILRDLFGHIANMRRQDSLARHIQNPKIPSLLSESIILRAFRSDPLASKFRGFHLFLGGKEADIIATKKGRRLRIEVKATGKNAFQNFGKKDVAADYLVWLHFGDLFEDTAKRDAVLVLLEQPKRYFAGPCKISLPDVRRKAAAGISERGIVLLPRRARVARRGGQIGHS